MEKLKQVTVIGIGSIVYLLSLICLLYSNAFMLNQLAGTALVFMTIANLALFGYSYRASKESSLAANSVLNVAMLTILVVYWVVTNWLAYTRILFRSHQITFTVIEILALGIMIVMALGLNLFGAKVLPARNGSGEKESIFEQYAGNVKVMPFISELETQLLSLKAQCESKVDLDQLNAVLEALKYSDRVKPSTFDAAIMNAKDSLFTSPTKGEGEAGFEGALETKLKALLLLVNQRNQEILNLGRGQ